MEQHPVSPVSAKEDAQNQLTYYRCHKIVRGGLIAQVIPSSDERGANLIIYGQAEAIPVDSKFLERHNPQQGTYYVLYEDGYESVSPADAFEGGYTPMDEISNATVEDIAQQCHEMNRLYCEALGDFSQVPWEQAGQWQQDSAINGVLFALQAADSTPEDSHENWYKHKLADGWKYGPVKDVEKKEHPCMVPYDDLPADQKFKDRLFKTICSLRFRAEGIG